MPGSGNGKRYEDVLDVLAAGIHVMTAVNIQHLETLNDVVARATGVRVRETVPNTFLDRADEVINVDVTVEELRNRLREGKIYRPEKVEQALSNFSAKATCRRSASWRCVPWPMRSGRRRPAIARVRDSSRRSFRNGSWSV